MALPMSTTDRSTSKTHLLAAKRRPASMNRRAAAYRCPACGDEETYDSLAACCRCCDECYADNSSSTTAQSGEQ
jgi:uncharacterized protein (DUF983 family)